MYREVAELIAVIGKSQFYEVLTKFLRTHISFNHLSILEFKRGAQPLVLHVDGETYDQDMSRYLSGLYLFDPYYDLYVNEGKTGVFLTNRRTLDDLEADESYKRYWSHLEGNTEIVVLYEAGGARCFHFGFMANLDCKNVLSPVKDFLLNFEAILGALVVRHETENEENGENAVSRREVHSAVSQLLQSFGSDILTNRERDVVKLVPKGHSSKSIAKLLGISSGTVGIHRGNIHQKFGVSGRGELLSLFFARLSQPQDADRSP